MNTQLTYENIQPFVSSLKAAIQHSQLKAVRAVNTSLVELYYVLGAALSVKTKQAKWGDKILEQVSKELQKELKGLKGFSAQNLKKMRLFYEAYPEQLGNCSLWQEINSENTFEIGSTLSNEITTKTGSTVSNQLKDTFWNISFSNHFSIISKISEPEIRLFYIEQTAKEGWSNRVLENYLKNKIHLQQQLPSNFEKTIIDLLFYNRQLQSLVAIELKRGKFKPEHLGQLSFYLNVLDEQVKLPNENQSIGIILCKEKNNTVVEYALRNNTQPMGVATFKTKQEMPNNVKDFLPSVEDLKQLLNTKNE